MLVRSMPAFRASGSPNSDPLSVRSGKGTVPGDQRKGDHILLPKFMLCHADAGTEIGKEFVVFSASEFSTIVVFVGDGAVVYCFWHTATEKL